MKKADMERRLLDLKAKQQAESEMVCPRCGQNKLKSPLTHNALSRYADLYICSECGMTEAGLAMMNNPLPLEQWAVFQEKSPRLDFKTLSMQGAVIRILSSQMEDLLRLHKAWVLREKGQSFDDLRTQALTTCSGMVDLWENPFCAVYLARDGKVLVRFRWDGTQSEIAVDTLPEAQK